MALFFLFLIASTLICLVFSSEQGQTKSNGLEGKAYHFMEHFLRKLSKDENFRLPNNFRQADGQLKPQSFEISAAADPQPCSSTGFVEVDKTKSNGVVLEYNYAPSVTGLASAPTDICLYFKGNFAAVNVNYLPNSGEADKSSLPILLGGQDVGLSCQNCWAYVGSDLKFQATCSTNTLSCSLAFVTGGQTGFNFDLTLKDPTWTQALETADILSNIPLVTLFQDPSSGIYIRAQPKLAVAVTGSISATGSSSIKSSLKTDVGLGIGLDGTKLTIAPTSDIKGTLPTITATSFQLKNPSLQVSMSFSPTVEWTIGFGCDNPGKVPSESSSSATCLYAAGTGIGLQAIIDTPITTTVSFQQSSNSDCTNSLGLSSSAAINQLTGIADILCTTLSNKGCLSYNFLTSAVKTDNVPLGKPVAGTQCISTSASPPSPSGSSSSSSSSLSDGEIAASVVVPVVVVGAAAGGYYYYHKSSSSPEPEEVYKPLYKENA